MSLNTVLRILLGILGFGYIGLQVFEYEIAGSGFCTLMLIILTILYHQFSKNRNKYFLLFLVLYSTAQLMGFVSWFIPVEWLQKLDFSYYLTNACYITSYIFLVRYITSEMKFKKVIKKFIGPILILLILDIFCVYIVTDAADSHFSVAEYILEFTYNGVIMAVLTAALINYLWRDDNKAMLCLIGSIFIVFSEIIQVAYFYVLSSNDLSATYATFLVMAFLFFYLESQLVHQESSISIEKEELSL